MARQKEVTVNGQKFKLQSVSPTWYYDLNDECGNTGGTKRNSAKYMDELFRNTVIFPGEVAAGGMGYFDDAEDLKTPEELVKAIESFLREGGKPSHGPAKSEAQ
jgi:hypothetical protein